MDNADAIYSGHAARPPSQGRLHAQGNAYLKRDFPKLDYIKKATIVKEEPEKKK